MKHADETVELILFLERPHDPHDRGKQRIDENVPETLPFDLGPAWIRSGICATTLPVIRA